ncbi:SxtJ family membrane protein, partial [bacterium]|nr:SxtJ family membrane protein [bacterium]
QKLWMKLAHALGWFNTRLLLILVFYLVLTPVGLLMRLFGKRPLSLGWDKDAPSYWIEREKKPFDPAQCEKHF